MSEQSARTVLVTSATTPVGRAITRALCADAGVRAVLGVHGPSEPSPPEEDTPVDPRGSARGTIRHVQADVTHHRELRDLLFGEAAREVDTLVCLPTFKAPEGASDRAFDLHVESTRQLLALAEERAPIQSFIFRSFGDVYQVRASEPLLIDEAHTLDLGSGTSQSPSQHSHVEADLSVSARIFDSRLRVAVLRCAEILAPQSGSRLHDYLSSKVSLRPLGYDPMVNVLSLEDAACAVLRAVTRDAAGVFNIPGRDTLPLSELIHLAGRLGLPLPGPLLAPLYRLRAALTSGRFEYSVDRSLFHYGAVLDGRKAAQAFGYIPEHPIELEALFDEKYRVKNTA